MRRPSSDVFDAMGPSGSAAGWQRIAADILLLAACVGIVYFLPLSDLPVIGEEARRARGAINMIESGDWLVVRQQGIVFPDRPPMSNWLIAITGLIRGTVDVVAIRLPSVLATLATTLLIYLYGVRLESRSTALIAAAAFATLGQVLQLGRLGESEAVFTFFVAASLLLWHLAFSLGRRPAFAFALGYSFTGLAALVKGIQAPVYFVGVTTIFLVLKRNWRWLFGLGQWLGVGCLLAIVGAWQLPYYRATDLETSLASWFDVVGPRLGLQGLVSNLVAYPGETFACLLPWSVLLFALASSTVRRPLARRHAAFTFAVVALAVTYPTVWFSAGAKGRYYMPLYPIAALLIGMIVDELSRASTGSSGARWRRFALHSAAALAGIAFVATGLRWILLTPQGSDVAGAALSTIAVAALSVLTLRWALAALRSPSPNATSRAILAATALLGLTYSTVWISNLERRRQDVRPLVAAAREMLPADHRLVSFGPVDPRFVYPFGQFIEEAPWPTSIEDLDPDVEYFCFDRRPTDTAEKRYAERGMSRWFTTGTLPFAWEEITSVSVAPRVENPPRVAVVIGRVLRDPQGQPLAADDRAASSTGR